MWDMKEGFGTCATPLGELLPGSLGYGSSLSSQRPCWRHLHQSGGGRTGRQEGVQRKEARPSGCAFEQDTGTFYFLAATESTALFSHVLLSRYSALLNQKGELRAKTPAAVRRTVWPCDLTGLPSV